MVQRIGVYTEKTAEHVLEVVRYLEAAGYVIKGDRRAKPQIAVPTPIYVRNDSGEDIPAFACMQATGTEEADGQNYIVVDKPADATGTAGPYLFNGPSVIEIGGYGIAFDGPVVRALGDGSSVVPGQGWTVVPGQWEIAAGGETAVVIGADDIDENVVRIRLTDAGTANTLYVFRLNAAFVSNAADADIYTIDGATITDTGEDATVHDPLAIFSVLGVDDYGLCIKQAGKYYAIQAPCP